MELWDVVARAGELVHWRLLVQEHLWVEACSVIHFRFPALVWLVLSLPAAPTKAVEVRSLPGTGLLQTVLEEGCRLVNDAHSQSGIRDDAPLLHSIAPAEDTHCIPDYRDFLRVGARRQSRPVVHRIAPVPGTPFGDQGTHRMPDLHE